MILFNLRQMSFLDFKHQSVYTCFNMTHMAVGYRTKIIISMFLSYNPNINSKSIIVTNINLNTEFLSFFL